jgi:hypothetical protein
MVDFPYIDEFIIVDSWRVASLRQRRQIERILSVSTVFGSLDHIHVESRGLRKVRIIIKHFVLHFFNGHV